MLYKKTHRQYLRQWRLGRKFKLHGSYIIHKVIEKPYIRSFEFDICSDGWILIVLTTGRIMFGGNIKWLD